MIGERPNVDFALAALAVALRLPDTAPLQLFALARSAGWLAHMLEQVESGCPDPAARPLYRREGASGLKALVSLLFAMHEQHSAYAVG